MDIKANNNRQMAVHDSINVIKVLLKSAWQNLFTKDQLSGTTCTNTLKLHVEKDPVIALVECGKSLMLFYMPVICLKCCRDTIH